MKRLIALFAIILLALPTVAVVGLTACATLGVPTPKTFNQKFAVGISTVTSARTTALTLLTATKITADDAANVNKQADVAREGLELARTIHAALPAQGDAKLAAVTLGLNALTGYLCSRDKSQPLCVGAP